MSTEDYGSTQNPDTPTRRRKRKRRADKPASIALPQLERRVLRNRFAPVEPLDEEQINLIHEATMTLLEEQGIEVIGDIALDILRKAGAEVDDNGIVRMDRGLVMQSIATAPEEFTVTPRNPDNILHVGGNVINFGMVSGPPNVHDCINGRRMGNIADFENLVRFGHPTRASFRPALVLAGHLMRPICALLPAVVVLKTWPTARWP